MSRCRLLAAYLSLHLLHPELARYLDPRYALKCAGE